MLFGKTVVELYSENVDDTLSEIIVIKRKDLDRCNKN